MSRPFFMDVLKGAIANAENLHLEDMALRKQDAIIDNLILRFRSGQLSQLDALLGIAKISAFRELCSTMNTETRQAIQEAITEAENA